MEPNEPVTGVPLPDLGEGVTEAELSRYLVEPGQAVTSGTPLAEVVTDKVSVEVASPSSGIVHALCFRAGDAVSPGDVLLEIRSEGGPDAVLAPERSVPESEPAGQPAESSVPAPERSGQPAGAQGPGQPAAFPWPVDANGEIAEREAAAVVIGGGPGGYVCAIRLAQLGVRPLLIEQADVGGTCLHSGCIPSKALISSAALADKVRHAGRLGIRTGDVAVDMAAVAAWRDETVRKLASGVSTLLRQNGVEVIQGTASFRGPGEVAVVHDGRSVVVRSPHIVVATGSEPIVLPGFVPDGVHVLDSRQALALHELPGSLAVIGGGYIGLELGMAFARLGSQVTVVEATAQVLPGFDPEIARFLEGRLKRLGMGLYLRARAEDWAAIRGGSIALGIEAEGAMRTINCDRILVTVGRRPRATGLNLAAIGLSTDGRGFIPVDDRMRTAVPGIYAIGDVAGQPMLAHKASRDGEVAAETIAGYRSGTEAESGAAGPGAPVIPAVAFTDPEVGVAGLMEHEARERGIEVAIGRFPFAASGRALTSGQTEGFVKVVSAADTGRILGVAMVGPNASDLIAEGVVAVQTGMHRDALAAIVHAHPTLPEAFREAALDAGGVALHVGPRREPARV